MSRTKRRLLVTGASGFLGWNIIKMFHEEWEITGTVFTHHIDTENARIIAIDLTDESALEGLFNRLRPDAVIHTAAATDPNYCEEHGEETKKINVDAAIAIAGLAADRRIPFAFTSTDIVFDGMKPPYSEDDRVSPVNVYGQQKAAAEEGILKVYPEAAVCRMPLMFGDAGPAASSFFQTMVESFRQGREIRLFEDEYRTPVSGTTAARGLLWALENVGGRIHLGGRQRISRYEFGVMVMKAMGIGNAKMIRCRQRDMIMAARRPLDVSLDSSCAESKGFQPPPLEEDVKQVFTAGGDGIEVTTQ